MINGLEARVNSIEEKLTDLDAREESDNLANERNLDRFIMSGDSSTFLVVLSLYYGIRSTMICTWVV